MKRLIRTALVLSILGGSLMAGGSAVDASMIGAQLTCDNGVHAATVDGPTMLSGHESYAPYVWVRWQYYDASTATWKAVPAPGVQRSTYVTPASFAWDSPGYWVVAEVYLYDEYTRKWNSLGFAQRPTVGGAMCMAGLNYDNN